MNEGEMGEKRKGETRSTGPSVAPGPGLPCLLVLGANEEVGGAVLRGVDHQGAVGGEQPPGSSGLVVLIGVTGSVDFLYVCVLHRQAAQGSLQT